MKPGNSNAIDECIQEDILKDFFTEYRKEIIEVGKHEYSYEKHIEYIKDESYNSGVQNSAELFAWLIDHDRSDDVKKSAKDSNYLAKLFNEFEVYKRNIK